MGKLTEDMLNYIHQKNRLVPGCGFIISGMLLIFANGIMRNFREHHHTLLNLRKAAFAINACYILGT